jgi:hypothetical protein
VWTVIVCTVLVNVAPGMQWRASGTVGAQTAAAVLVDVQNTAELRTQFNSDSGNARLVLLLSPT